MLLKNVSFELIQAVKDDGKSFITFQPQETREVTQAEGEWFMERYNDSKTYFRQVSSTVTEVFSDSEPVGTPVEDSPEVFVCNICGKTAGSKAGLSSHVRNAHK